MTDNKTALYQRLFSNALNQYIFHGPSISVTGTCLYHSQGNFCAIGCNFEPETAKKLDKALTDTDSGIYVLISGSAEVALDDLPPLPEWINVKNEEFLSELQGIHDMMQDTYNYLVSMEDFAIRYGLKFQ